MGFNPKTLNSISNILKVKSVNNFLRIRFIFSKNKKKKQKDFHGNYDNLDGDGYNSY